jgi:hypothetical protein
MEIVYTLGSRNLEGEVPAPGTKGGVEGGCFVFVRHLWACDSTAWLPGELGVLLSAPQDFVVLGVRLGVFCARFPPREAYIFLWRVVT